LRDRREDILPLATSFAEHVRSSNSSATFLFKLRISLSSVVDLDEQVLRWRAHDKLLADAGV
jgi:hypothetical protein